MKRNKIILVISRLLNVNYVIMKGNRKHDSPKHSTGIEKKS
jgi:hypothetical protein